MIETLQIIKKECPLHRSETYLNNSTPTGFDIVALDGNDITDEREGLLLYKDGTVCDDHFSDNSAHAICREMGYHGMLSWSSGVSHWQTYRAITLDDVSCDSDVWSSCTSKEVHNCRHLEDVFISCELG